MNKEQSSTLIQEVPKHKFALEEKYKEDKKSKPKEKRTTGILEPAKSIPANKILSKVAVKINFK